ncbi:D-alanyl-D-alanine dipeptidase [Legionella busanensis]|uniref:D-alanyl-D-alanine dipeptidase n=1 Tax=Legionella busanensis TaxID=190655 RepID=A0A378JN87_9GAMM|nr:M15 family metallopeptidase [Legionella busanensis]STX52836.1 D-alanyl-D-alanine dipeptidase [Legionella busanensis]
MKKVLLNLSFIVIIFLSANKNSVYAKDNHIVLITDPNVLAIPIKDNGESLIDLKNQKEIAYGSSPEIPNNHDYTKLRKTVYQKLNQAQKLLPKGLHFCLYEGYRSLALQKNLFDRRFDIVKKKHPNWSREQIFKETTKLVSPVVNLDNTKNIPAHSTGGAIDIYLIDDTGKPVDMGIHPKDWIKDDGSLSRTASKKISLQARQNRAIMNRALATVGFVNYPTEYWHWSYGDRYWAFFMQEPNALYSSYTK